MSDHFIEFHAYDKDGNFLTILDGAFAKAYICQINGLGGGSFRIYAEDDKATDTNLQIGNIIKVIYEGSAVGAWVIEHKNEVLVGSAEGASETISVKGRGLLSMLETCIVYPSDSDDPKTVERAWSSVTRAEIIRDLLAEASARGWDRLTTDFTDSLDSDSVAFTDSNTLSYKAGETLLSVALNHAELGTDIVATPAGVLQYYVSKGSDKTDDVFFRKGLNILSCDLETDGLKLRNAALGEGQFLLATSSDSTSIGTYDRREIYLQAENATDSTQLALLLQALLVTTADPVERITLSAAVEPYAPWSDYDLGDTVRIEILDKISGDYRVVGIGVQEQADTLVVELEITTLRQLWLEDLRKAVEQGNASDIVSLANKIGALQTGSQKLRVQVVADSTERAAVTNPVEGMLVQEEDTGDVYKYHDDDWVYVSGEETRVANAAANTNTPSGATAYQWPVYDAGGVLIGYVPVYGSAW